MGRKDVMLHFELVLTQFQEVIGFINIGSQTKNKNGKIQQKSR